MKYDQATKVVLLLLFIHLKVWRSSISTVQSSLRLQDETILGISPTTLGHSPICTDRQCILGSWGLCIWEIMPRTRLCDQCVLKDLLPEGFLDCGKIGVYLHKLCCIFALILVSQNTVHIQGCRSLRWIQEFCSHLLDRHTSILQDFDQVKFHTSWGKWISLFQSNWNGVDASWDEVIWGSHSILKHIGGMLATQCG